MAAAAQTALALGVPIYGLNSNAGDATGLSAYVAMSELVAGVQAAEAAKKSLADAVVTNPCCAVTQPPQRDLTISPVCVERWMGPTPRPTSRSRAS